MNRVLDNIDNDLRDKIINVACFIEDCVFMENLKDKMVFLCPRKNIKDFNLNYFKIHITRQKKPLYKDWYSYIKNYNKIENLINEETTKKFGNIKTRYDDGLFFCHINSSSYFGNGVHDKLWIAVIEAMNEALKS